MIVRCQFSFRTPVLTERTRATERAPKPSVRNDADSALVRVRRAGRMALNFALDDPI